MKHSWFRRMVARARRLARIALGLPDRLLHPARRHRSAQLLRTLPPGPILFVCYGNICRSPYAAAAAGAKLGAAGFTVWSAGFVGPDRCSPDEAQAEARERGYDLSSHRSRLLTHELVQASGWIVVMNAAQRRAVTDLYRAAPSRVLVLGDFDPLPIENREIRDPWNQPREVFKASYDRIDRCIGEFVKAITRRD